VGALLPGETAGERSGPRFPVDRAWAGVGRGSFPPRARWGRRWGVVMEGLRMGHNFPADDATRRWFRKQIQ